MSSRFSEHAPEADLGCRLGCDGAASARGVTNEHDRSHDECGLVPGPYDCWADQVLGWASVDRALPAGSADASAGLGCAGADGFDTARAPPLVAPLVGDCDCSRGRPDGHRRVQWGP